MSKFCRECCKEFKGWCKSFTRTETLLTIIECVLLLLFIVFLVFLVLHLISCKGNEPITDVNKPNEDRTTTSGVDTTTAKSDPKDITNPEILESSTIITTPNTDPRATTKTQSTQTRATVSTRGTKCTAVYPTEILKGEVSTPSTRCTANYSATETPEVGDYTDTDAFETTDNPEEEPDGELASDDEKEVVIALVKIKPSGITFGCILTVLSEHWTVTAASCLDSIEEVDSLDSFVMMDNYGEVVQGRSHSIVDVRVHPLYEGGNKTYDLALLRTEEPLGRKPVLLPTLVDYFRITIGEKFAILGFGKFRSIDNSALGKRVHSVPVFALPVKHCAAASFEERHLRPLFPVAHARCGAAPLCVGVLRSRAAPCNYCAGAPLLRRRALLGVMSDNEACGSACEPALYANVAQLKDWIEGVMDNK